MRELNNREPGSPQDRREARPEEVRFDQEYTLSSYGKRKASSRAGRFPDPRRARLRRRRRRGVLVVGLWKRTAGHGGHLRRRGGGLPRPQRVLPPSARRQPLALPPRLRSRLHRVLHRLVPRLVQSGSRSRRVAGLGGRLPGVRAGSGRRAPSLERRSAGRGGPVPRPLGGLLPRRPPLLRIAQAIDAGGDAHLGLHLRTGVRRGNRILVPRLPSTPRFGGVAVVRWQTG